VKLIFLGTPTPAVPSLRALIDAGHEVPLAVTRRDRPVGRSRQPQAPPVKRAALASGIEVFQPKRVRDAAFRDRLASVRPDLLVVVAYGRILTGEVLRLAPEGAINLHFSLLPRYRGAAPVQWALARGERETGVTTMSMNERLDEGDLLLQRTVPIEPTEHAPALQGRLAVIGAELLIETLDRIKTGSLEPRPQKDDEATQAPRLSAADGEIDRARSAGEIEGRVRGFDPWPGVWMRIGGRRIRIVSAHEVTGPPSPEPPGLISELTDEGLILICGGGSRLALETVQPEARRAMAARDAVNGRHLEPGQRLEEPPPREREK
jgi:methionyl-tRNA formyltransferase